MKKTGGRVAVTALARKYLVRGVAKNEDAFAKISCRQRRSRNG